MNANAVPPKTKIRIAHSPDSDDAFMFYALATGKITSPAYEFTIERHDIEELNRLAGDGLYDLTALSIHAYAHLSEKYILTASGASMAAGDYGPLVVSRDPLSPEELKNKTVAIPGKRTTAYLVLKIAQPKIRPVVVPFEEIMNTVLAGNADAGLIIHEGQLRYEKLGLKKVVLLTDCWKEMAGDLPLPLGGNALKRELGHKHLKELSRLQKQSIVYAAKNAAAARDYALRFKRGLSAEQVDRYLGWYANERTVDMGADGIRAIETLFELAHEHGLITKKIPVEVV